MLNSIELQRRLDTPEDRKQVLVTDARQRFPTSKYITHLSGAASLRIGGAYLCEGFSHSMFHAAANAPALLRKDDSWELKISSKARFSKGRVEGFRIQPGICWKIGFDRVDQERSLEFYTQTLQFAERCQHTCGAFDSLSGETLCAE
jgi:hypothetical protein